MKIIEVKVQQIEKGWLTKTTINFGINKLFTANFFKKEDEALKFKEFLNDHKNSWQHKIYLIPSTYIRNIKEENSGKWVQVVDTQFSLYYPKSK